MLRPRDSDHGDRHEEHQEAELLVSLLQGAQQRLEAGEVPHKLIIVAQIREGNEIRRSLSLALRFM